MRVLVMEGQAGRGEVAGPNNNIICVNDESLDLGDTKCFTERNTTADARSRERERRETEKRRMKGIRKRVRG